MTITRALPMVTAKTVFVKIIGQRTGAFDPNNPSTETLPPYIQIDACPTMKRSTNKVEWWARIRPMGVEYDEVASRGVAETGIRAEHITTLDLGPDVPEKDVSFY